MGTPVGLIVGVVEGILGFFLILAAIIFVLIFVFNRRGDINVGLDISCKEKEINISYNDLTLHEQVGDSSYDDVYNATWDRPEGGIQVAVKKLRTSKLSEELCRELDKKLDP